MTAPHVLAELDRLAGLLDEVADTVRSVVLDAHEGDRYALLEGVTTVDVGVSHLRREMARAGGDR